MRHLTGIFFLILYLGWSISSLFGRDFNNIISLEDQKKLEILFHHMMTGDYFPCTLFGNKPMTFQELQVDPWKISSRQMLNPYYFFHLEEGWKTWEKHKALFPSKRFIFTMIPCKAGYQFIILINKQAFEETFQKNQDIFQKALGANITVDKMLKEFEEGQKTFEEILNDHEGLVGLVLGYGRENSIKVHRSEALKLQLLKKNLHPLAPFSQQEELPKKIQNVLKFRADNLFRKGVKWHQIMHYSDVKIEKKDIYKEIISLSNNSNFFRLDGDYLPFYLEAPNFSCLKDSRETEHLKKEYGEAMKRARLACKQTSFLNAFLDQYSQ